ncbi:ARHGH-like protein [Mya arenaria]|uniref:ARHGH-like protein n=1 Tax=Mya arenaria TaxID=6604 RepID=A0ABY7DRH2_MYAAR|nr:ARHGH-like protein [Mya arenaria]
MEENVTPSDDEKSKRVSPKVARPKLPKFGSQTLGHHFRHKTDPGQASEIKNLMEEIKKWKEGSIFDKTPIRTKMIKPQQMIPKAHSTQTSPRSSPPPGSPGSGKRSSSLNRNRSKSLKLLTDKLKSPKGGSTKDAPSSPGVVMSQSTPPGTDMFSKSNNTVGLDAPIFVVDTGDGETEQEMRPMQESDKERTSIVEPIPEHDERIEEDDKERDNETKPDYDRSFDKNVSFLKTDVVKPKVKYVGQNIDEETAAMSDGDSPVTHVSSFTLHPIDRNSQFLRLRQTAPPKRRPGYAGLSLPRPKISMFKKQPDDSSQEPARSMDDSVIKKPTKLDLPGFSSMRKLSTPKCLPLLKSKEEFGALDISGHNLFRTPSTDSPPSFIGEENAIESPSDSKSLDGDRSEPQGAFSDNFNVESEQEIVVDDKPEKRISRSPKQKSKSDPSGNKTFDFETAGVINSSQSKSFPLLDKEYPPGSIEEISEVEDSGTETVTDNLERPDPTELDILNNNENPTLEEQRQSSGASVSFSDTDRFENDSVSDDTSLFSSQSNISEPFDDPSCKTLILEGFPRPFSEGMAPLQEDGDEDALTNSCGSESSTSTPVSYSPTGTLERQHNLLNVPSPKRPILRSVSSASVLQRERKLSGNNKDKENHRKHSLTTGDDTVPIEGPPMDFLPIGDAGNVLASSMPAVWNMDRLPSMSPERETQYVKDKRYHITEELFRNEREYVDALKMLKERYMDPLKTVSGIDERVVDNIFYMIPEILTHHQIYLEFLNQIWTRWNTDTSTVGDLIQKTFSGQTVQDSYLSFVENYKTSGKQCQKESGSKLSLKDLIVRPIQRIPRYELLIQRLLVNTPPDHPDYALLQDAEKVMHEFARKIGSLSETNTEDGQQETLKKLELLLITDNKKDQCCIWMFSDVLIISSVKRKSGPVTRKVSIILKSPTGQDFAENVKHKVWLKVGLDDIEIVKSARTLKREASLDREQVEEDLDLLSMIQDVASKLNCQHAALDDCMKELTQNLNKQLFSCAAPIDGVNSSGHRDVWVCNSDGYVGHMCLLSLQPEPIVTLNTPVPGCNARILCISAVPALASLRRKSSCKRYSKHGPPSPMGECGPRISVEEVDSAITEEDPRPDEFFPSDFPVDEVSEEGYQSDSSSSDDETDDDYIATRKLYVEDFDAKRPSTSSGSTGGPDSITTTGAWHQDRNKSTIIHIFQCTDNIKTTKNKLKIQLGYPVYCILYLDNKVFVSLSNGDLIVYRRDSDGLWDTENPYTRAIGSVTGPIVRMLAVAGKLWCGRQNSICVINPLTLSIEKTFQMHQDSNRSVQCIVNSGQGVWIAAQQSSKDLLWIGTSAGVILTVPVPKITSTTSKGSLTAPTVTGRVHGHTGHVRFLTCVEMSPINMPPILGSGKTRADTANNNRDPPSPHDISKRRSSVATMTAALATRMLVISGGDGYEDFRTNVVNESAGKDDSTNHLLLWQV